MKITCVSAANIQVAKDHSASVHTCELIRELLLADQPVAQVETLRLIDYTMKPCDMCGRCVKTGLCANDAGFNQIFKSLASSDGLFFVVPHYAPLPSKLMILFEKMQEIAYLRWCADENYRFPLAGKPVGVIGHGGQEPTWSVLDYYRRTIIDPVAAALCALGLRVVSAGAESPNGSAFGIQSLSKRPGSIFVDIQHDWEDVRRRIAPLVQNFAGFVQ